VLDIDEFKAIEQLYWSNFKWWSQTISLSNVWFIVHVSCLYVRAWLPKWVDQGSEHDNSKDTENNMICVFIDKALLFFTSGGKSLSSSLFHLWIGLEFRSPFLLWRLGFYVWHSYIYLNDITRTWKLRFYINFCVGFIF
jgi:hypothetical protein